VGDAGLLAGNEIGGGCKEMKLEGVFFVNKVNLSPTERNETDAGLFFILHFTFFIFFYFTFYFVPSVL